MDYKGEHPTARQLQAILLRADDYLSDITFPAGIRSRPPRATQPLMQPIIDIEEAASKAHNTTSTRDLSVTKWRNALNNNTRLTCKYVASPDDSRNIKKVMARFREWLDELLQGGHGLDEPLIWVPASAGYTNEGPRRRYHYQSHNSVSHYITFFDAVARSMGLGFGLRWRVVYKPHSEETIRMAEHVFSCLNGTDLCMNGLNVAAAGQSNASGRRTWHGAYENHMKDTVRHWSFKENVKSLVLQIAADHKDLLRVRALEQVLTRLRELKAEHEALVKEETAARNKEREAEMKLKQGLADLLPLLTRQLSGLHELQQGCSTLEDLESKMREIMIRSGMEQSTKNTVAPGGPQVIAKQTVQAQPQLQTQQGTQAPDLSVPGTYPRYSLLLGSPQLTMFIGLNLFNTIISRPTNRPAVRPPQTMLVNRATNIGNSRLSQRHTASTQHSDSDDDDDIIMPTAFPRFFVQDPSPIIKQEPEYYDDVQVEEEVRDTFIDEVVQRLESNEGWGDMNWASDTDNEAAPTLGPGLTSEDSDDDDDEDEEDDDPPIGRRRGPHALTSSQTVGSQSPASSKPIGSSTSMNAVQPLNAAPRPPLTYPLVIIRGRTRLAAPAQAPIGPPAQAPIRASVPAPRPVQAPARQQQPVQKVSGIRTPVDEITNVKRGDRSKYYVTVRLGRNSRTVAWSDVSHTASFALADYLHYNPGKKNQFPVNWRPPFGWVAP